LVAVELVLAFLCFLLLLPLLLLLVLFPLLPLLCDLEAGAEVSDFAAAEAAGAADGVSAAREAAAKLKVKRTVVIRVADLFMKSPNGGDAKRRAEYA
jgi:hypothetical protein